MGYGYRQWAPYVPVARRRAQAAAHVKRMAKQTGEQATPVVATGRSAAKSVWGQAWCRHIEGFSDAENRLPRGMRYLRNGSVVDLKIRPGVVQALVSGSQIYKIKITIQKLSPTAWKQLKSKSAGSISSVIDLLAGKFSETVMNRLTDGKTGLFPRHSEISMSCSCPDSAGMCKHLAAVMYGIGTRLDSAPELLFTLRDVNHLELVGQALESDNLSQAFDGTAAPALEGVDLGEMFGIDLDTSPASGSKVSAKKKKPAAARGKKSQTSTAARAKLARPKAGITADGPPTDVNADVPAKPVRSKSRKAATPTTTASGTKPARTATSKARSAKTPTAKTAARTTLPTVKAVKAAKKSPLRKAARKKTSM